MSRYESINPKFWGDDKVLVLSWQATLLWVYLMTCDESHGLSGIVDVANTTLLTKAKLKTQNNLRKARTELVDLGRVRFYPTSWWWIVNRSKHHCRSTTQWQGVRNQLTEPDVPKQMALDFVAKYNYRPELHSLSESLRKG